MNENTKYGLVASWGILMGVLFSYGTASISEDRASKKLESQRVEFKKDDSLDAVLQLIFNSKNVEQVQLFAVDNTEKTETNIAVYLGLRPNSGYSVNVEQILDKGNTYQVSIKERTPKEGEVTAQVISELVAVVKTKYLNKPIEWVVQRE